MAKNIASTGINTGVPKLVSTAAVDAKIIGAGITAGAIITIHSLLLDKPFMRPIVGVFIATFLLAAMSTAGAPQIAANLALLLAGTVIVIYGAPILQVMRKL